MKTCEPYWIVSSLALSFLFFAAAAQAQPEDNPLSPWYLSDAEDDDKRWNFELILGVESEPDYTGSDDNELEPDADFRAIYRDRRGNRYFFSLGEVSAIFDLNDRTLFRAKLELEEGRETENEALAGFPEGESTLEGEFWLARRFGNAWLAGIFQPDLLDRGKGLVWFIGAGYDRTLANGKLRLGPRVDVSWGDAEHMRTEFGISAEQSTISGFPEYEPGAGLKSATAGLSLQYYFSRRWSLLADVEVEHYFSKAADSPLIDIAGTDLTYEAGVGVFFRF